MAANNASNLSYTAALASYGGGSASITFSDDRINGQSIVGGNIETSANDVYILRVSPENGGIKFVLSGNPGSSTFTYWVFNLFKA